MVGKARYGYHGPAGGCEVIQERGQDQRGEGGAQDGADLGVLDTE